MSATAKAKAPKEHLNNSFAMAFAAHPPMQLSSTNYLSALLARLSSKLAIAIATAQKLRFSLSPIKTFTMVISLSFYWDSKAEFCQVY